MIIKSATRIWYKKISDFRSEIFWWNQQGSNLWPYACKAYALPAELWFRFSPSVLYHMPRWLSTDHGGQKRDDDRFSFFKNATDISMENSWNVFLFVVQLSMFERNRAWDQAKTHSELSGCGAVWYAYSVLPKRSVFSEKWRSCV